MIFAEGRGWAEGVSGKADVWYCTNIELFDYEDARRRMVIGANGKFVFNPSARSVTLLMGATGGSEGKLVEVPGGATVGLV